MPDAGLVLDYNRYMYVRGNPLKYTDPTGNSACVALGPQLGILCQAVEVIQRYGPAVVAAAGGLASAAGLTAALDVTADDDASATDLYPTPAVDGSTITSSFPLPGSTTVGLDSSIIMSAKPLTPDEERLVNQVDQIPDFLDDHPDLEDEARRVRQGEELESGRDHVREAMNRVNSLEKAIRHLNGVRPFRSPEAQQTIDNTVTRGQDYLKQLNDILRGD